MFNRISKFAMAFMVVAIVSTACGGSGNTASDKDIARVETKIDQLTEQVKDLSTTTTVSDTITDESTTTTVAPYDPIQSCLDSKQRTLENLTKYDLGLPTGAFFKGSCYDESTDAVWVYPGGPEDMWAPNIQFGPLDFVDGVFSFPITSESGVVPNNLAHPVWPDALTINDMLPGTYACWMYGNLDIRTFVIGEVTAIVYERDPDTARIRWTESEGSNKHSLDTYGVLPYQDGTWSLDRLVAGPCPED